jgi:molecular chaperone GrpE
MEGERPNQTEETLTVPGELEERISQLQKELGMQVQLAEDRLNRLKYLQAEFDNYRKQFEREKEAIISLAEEHLMVELLILLDDLERILENSLEVVDRQAIELLYRNMIKILQNHGLKRIEAKGKKFDPYYHEAFCMVPTEEEDGIVLEEYQPGYLLRFKVIRPAKVKVAEKRCKEE